MCHNIYRIKTCMDLGRPVILLNLDDLYESLYDALNQYFSKWGDKKFVDLGLGTHRVKAFVNDGFRLAKNKHQKTEKDKKINANCYAYSWGFLYVLDSLLSVCNLASISFSSFIAAKDI